ncbi:hypothetical protein LTZ17_11815 [Lacticaseibacillus casei]|uniref:Uncharacterized protein n=1 Tax=Lacticaseibacillus zeae TaxID=57037 RepID=A0A5R8LS01_LACZE|nr:hypothetical protein [Lacticaseibacillus casei]TLF39938.1 hypothetical protein FEI14_11400 [Lacticaseibacillus zeae]
MNPLASVVPGELKKAAINFSKSLYPLLKLIAAFVNMLLISCVPRHGTSKIDEKNEVAGKVVFLQLGVIKESGKI